jgi:glucose/arabinose dehydrogenase
MELPVANGLNFPTSLTFDAEGRLYVAESGLPFAGAAKGGRVLCIDPGGNCNCLIDNLRAPVTGLVHYREGLYVSHSGDYGRIGRLSLSGEWTTIVDRLPGPGNYHVNMIAVGPDEKIYFGQGAMTNSGIIGLDAYELAWLRQLPHDYDRPGYTIQLTGWNVTTPDSSAKGNRRSAITGAFSPFGSSTLPGQRIAGTLPCTAAVLRCNLDGSELELVAWGLRNAFGIGFLPDGRLLVTDQGPDDRGSRPIGNAPDLLYEVRSGKWYGWPDFIGGVPVTDPRFRPERGSAPRFLIENHAELPSPEIPLAVFPANSAATKFDIAPPNAGRWCGHIFVTLFGDERPMTSPATSQVGRDIVRIDPSNWSLHFSGTKSLLRPIDLRFHPNGDLYVLDFGAFEITREGKVIAQAESGKICKVPQ